MNENDALQDPISEALDTPSPQAEALPPDGRQDEDGYNRDDSLDGGDSNDALPPPDAQNPPSDPLPVEEDRTEALARELAELKKELDLRRTESARMERERAEFTALYPQTPLLSLPDSVWEDVRRGVPLAAAYALAARRAEVQAQKADAANRDNQRRSAGALPGTESDYFSPAEVRSMTPSEVHTNYRKILASMKQWH